MNFLDIHSHILPDVDDGAKDLETSEKMLTLLKAQGVTSVIATPHFDASSENIDVFEERVNAAYDSLREKIKYSDLPEVYLGCEVYYFSGIGDVDDIKRLCIKNTDYLLLEFGVLDFDYKVLDDIEKLSTQKNVVPIIAHIERYSRFKGYKNLLDLVETGVVLSQVNASAVLNASSFRTIKKLCKRNLVNFLGSDAHSLTSRPPQIKQALDFIAKKISPHMSNHLIHNSERLAEELQESNI